METKVQYQMVQDDVPIVLRDKRTEKRFFIDNIIVDVYGEIIGPYGHAVYNVLTRHSTADTAKGSFPAHKTIARKAGCGIAKVKEVIKLFERLRLIKVLHRFDTETNRQTSNEYWILDPPAKVAMVDTPRGVSADTGGGVSEKATKNPPVKESSSNYSLKKPKQKPPQLPGIPTIEPDTPGADYLFQRLKREYAAKKQRAPAKFGTLAQKEKFTAAEAKADGEIKGFVDAALEAGILPVKSVVAYVAACANGDKRKEPDNVETLSDGRTHTKVTGRL